MAIQIREKRLGARSSSLGMSSKGGSRLSAGVRALGLAWVAATAACGAATPPAPASASASAAAPASNAGAPTAPESNAVAPTAPTSASKPLAFIEDDYPRALAEARAKKRPLFVDAWATWCHTCLSMREYVFPTAELRARGDDFVWLSIDTEKPEAAAFMRTHPMEAWPTLWVIDPATEAPALKWNGSATAGELAGLLDDAKLAIAQGDRGGDAGAAYVRGIKQTAEGQGAAAIESFRAALAAAPEGWPKRARVLEALSARLVAQKNFSADVELAAAELAKMPPGTSAKSVAYDALRSVTQLPPGAKSAGKRDEVLATTEKLAGALAGKILADDLSDLYDLLVDTMGELGRKDEKLRIARAWAAMLEGEAGKAATPAARAVFDAHRLGAYLALGEPERAVPMLEASEKDFPGDYNPKARLAAAYLAMKRYDDALVAIERCLAVSYGPRKMRHFTVKADILAAKGDRAGEKAALDAAIAHGRTLVPPGGPPSAPARALAALEARRKKLP